MATIKRNISGDYFYHVYNCGVEKRNIFIRRTNYERFLDVIAYYIYDQSLPFTQFMDLDLDHRPPPPDWSSRRVTIFAYCLMPNHFHFLIKQKRELGISSFISDLTNSYTKYFNFKYQRLGHLLQGRFKARVIDNEASLMQVVRYIHLNPAVSSRVDWRENLENYPYSSYFNFVNKKDSSIIKIGEISIYFDLDDHRNFVESKWKEFDPKTIEELIFGKNSNGSRG